MLIRNNIPLATLIFVLTLTLSSAYSQVIVDPIGVMVSLENEEELQEVITLYNDSDEAVRFDARLIKPERDNDRQIGPRRDDPGEILDRFSPPGGAVNHYNVGLAWDNEMNLMWNNDFHTGTASALDPNNNFEPAVQFNVEARCMSTALLNGHLYMVVDPQRYLTHYDREGNRLQNVEFNFTTLAVTASQELQLLFVMSLENNNRGPVYVYRMQDDGMLGEQVGVIDWLNFVESRPCRSMLWADLHHEGQLWFHTTTGPGGNLNHAWQCAVDTDNWEITERVQVFQTRNEAQGPQHWDGIGHDGHNLWVSFWAISDVYIMDDGITEPHWLAVDPLNGEIPANDEFAINLNFSSASQEPGIYEFYLGFKINEEAESSILMSVVMSLESITGDLQGIVTNAAANQPIENVKVEIDYFEYIRFTDDNGEYSIPALPQGNYELTFTATDYLPQIAQLTVDESGEYELNIEMLHAECNLSIQQVQTNLPPDMSTEFNFLATNDGNGPLTFRTERELIGDANAEPWAFRRTYPVSELTNDDRIQGVVFANENFYAAGSANRTKVMYVISRDGQLIDTFDQSSASTYGYTDLAWDGELIWGTGERRVYGFTPEGELEISWDGPYATNNNLAWDSENQGLWISGNTTNITLYNREGERLREHGRQGLRMYGLAYWPEDPDGYNLYIFHNPTGEIQAVTKMNTVNGDTLPVVITEPPGGGRPAASFITNEFDVYSWVFVTISNAGADDRIDIWQLDARKDWMSIIPTEGVIAAGESEGFVLTLDATGLPTVRFEGQIVFYHDGINGQTTLPITLDVAEGRVEVNRVYEFTPGWNMISFNVDPLEDNVVELFSPLVEQDRLVMLKDGAGRFYRPEFGFNNIPRWVVSEGYQARLTEAASLDVLGINMLADDPIQLSRGWQIISYFPRQQVDVMIGFVNIADNLEIAKDVAGRFYLPSWGFSNMLPLREGQGYQMKMIEADELVINFQQVASDLRWNHASIQPSRSVNQTDQNMSVLVLSDDYTGEIDIYANDRLIGTGILHNGATGIAVWGDESITGQELRIDPINSAEALFLKTEDLQGTGIYQTDGLWVVKVSENAIPAEWGLMGVYPNPFNINTKVHFSLKESDRVEVALFDITGRHVLNVFNGRLEAGDHYLTIDGKSLAAGVYLLQVNTGGSSWKQKIALVK